MYQNKYHMLYVIVFACLTSSGAVQAAAEGPRLLLEVGVDRSLVPCRAVNACAGLTDGLEDISDLVQRIAVDSGCLAALQAYASDCSELEIEKKVSESTPTALIFLGGNVQCMVKGTLKFRDGTLVLVVGTEAQGLPLLAGKWDATKSKSKNLRDLVIKRGPLRGIFPATLSAL